ncbi:hypothetical protein [Serratia fonticola]|uniref:hypothetical protein n=1 Tax=Serratia fonticola TaxID=47917 RepID=UPI00301CAB2A
MRDIKRNNMLLRRRLVTLLDIIRRIALGHDIGHCVHVANLAEAELRSALDMLDAIIATERQEAK